MFFRRKWVLFLLPLLYFSDCKKVTEEVGLVGVCPIVVSTNPVDSAVNVNIGASVAAVFNEVMDSSTINVQTFTLFQGSTPIAGVVTYSGTTATFMPLATLMPNTKYTATITTGVRDRAKNAMVLDYVWTFTTGAAPDIIPPIVVSTVPANLATLVALNTLVSATFSEAMKASTISAATFTVKQGVTAVTGVVTYTGNTATFTPAADLLPGRVYTATITTGAQDLAGNALAANYVWTFTTLIPDIIPPTVVSTVPAGLATNVAVNTLVSATFSEAMAPATISGTTFTVKQGATAVTGVVTYTGNTATFTPAADLLPGRVYTATITTGAQDLAGNALAANYVWTFTTFLPDIIPPTVLITDPANLATSVAIDKKITATFSEAMSPATISTTTFTLKQGATAIAGLVTYAGTTATFSPLVDLDINTTYTATITTGAKDLAGNALAANYVWTFTTLLPPPNLASAAFFGAFGGGAGATNQGLNTVINNGRLGTTAASTLITGFHDGMTNDVYTETPLNVGDVKGGIFTAPPPPGTAASFLIATNAALDALNAYNSISPASKPGGSDPGAGELGGLTLAPGIYKSASGTFNISNGDLTLDGKGDPNAVWIFQTGTSLTVGIAGPTGAKSVILKNGAAAKNVFWYVGSAATINGAGGGTMVGTIIASAGVTFSTAGNAVQTVLNGRALSLNASVTMVNTTINVP